MQFIRRFRGTAGRVIVSLAAVIVPATAFAQAAPAPNLERTPPVWLGYFLIVVLTGALMAVSLMPSKRGHQD